MTTFFLVFSILLGITGLGNSADVTVIPEVHLANVSTIYSDSTDLKRIIIYQYDVDPALIGNGALRIHTSIPEASANEFHPLTIVVKQEAGIMSWDLPYIVRENRRESWYHSVNRTLCPLANSSYWNLQMGPVLDATHRVLVEVSTSSPKVIPFSLAVKIEPTFSVAFDEKYTTTVSPSAPQYFKIEIPMDVEVGQIIVESPDKICMIMSIQNLSCPVQSTEDSVRFQGMYQTVSTKGGISLPRREFPHGMYVVFIVKNDDFACSGPYHYPLLKRTKEVKFRLVRKITEMEYLYATIGALGMFFGAYVLVFFVSCVLCIRTRRGDVLPDAEVVTPLLVEGPSTSEGYGAIGDGPEQNPDEIMTAGVMEVDSISQDSSINEEEVDFLEDADRDKDIFRTKTFLYVADLSKKHSKVLSKKSQLYHWNLWTIAVFYGLPVVQLMVTYQMMTDTTGNQDLCYYNFLCAHPLGILMDFNHVYSNLGYILLGGLFMVVTWRKDLVHRRRVAVNPMLESHLGIPRHFGIFYAMGLALIMEGILSGCYHVCPNHTNFQFDTAFMYTIAILILLKIYQSRHPDINANAYTAYGALAFLIFVGVIGVLNGSRLFWILFTSFYVLSSLLLSIQIYYMGRWRLNIGIFKRIWLVIYNDLRSLFGGNWRSLKPMYPDRLIALLVMNGCNWAMAGYGVNTFYSEGGDFASFLLAIMISNVFLYTLFYIAMKLRHRERIPYPSFIYLLISITTGSAATYFFFNKSTSWALTPAMSREYNQECKLFHFYDNHDIWHFLSAASLFLSFMTLLTLDDDLDFVPRTKIPVF